MIKSFFCSVYRRRSSVIVIHQEGFLELRRGLSSSSSSCSVFHNNLFNPIKIKRDIIHHYLSYVNNYNNIHTSSYSLNPKKKKVKVETLTLIDNHQEKMYQTKIGQFFTKKEDTPSPQKKPELAIKAKKPKKESSEDEGEEERKREELDRKTRKKKAVWKISSQAAPVGVEEGSGNEEEEEKEGSSSTSGKDEKDVGTKRKSDEIENEEGDKGKKKQKKGKGVSPSSTSGSSNDGGRKRKSKENGKGGKKLRKRIIVEENSESEEEKGKEEEEKMNGKEEEEEERPSESRKKVKKEESPKKNGKGKAKGKSPSSTPAVKGKVQKDKSPEKKKDSSPSPTKKKEASPSPSKNKEASPSPSKNKKEETEEEGDTPKEDSDKKPTPRNPFAAMMGRSSKAKQSTNSNSNSEKGDGDSKAGGNEKKVKGGGTAAPKGWDPDYDPSKSKYHPIDDASWEKGERVPYLALAKTLEYIEATSSRLKFIEILANYFRSVILLSPEDLLMSVYLCLNKLAPAYEGVELGVAETNVMKALEQATGRPLAKIKAEAKEKGDLGLVAENSRSGQQTLIPPPPLTVASVFKKLKEVASMSGQASTGRKIDLIKSMIVACKYSEARYLARSLLGKLRIGLAEQSLLQAIAQATYLTPPNQDLTVWPPKIINAGNKLSSESLKAKIEEHAYIIKSCYCECPNYDILVKALLEVGIEGLPERCKLTPGIPPRPMLAQPTKGVSDVLDRFEGKRFTCEYKYDGERAQIHLLEDGTIRVYSRNQEDNTSKYPDIISRFKSCLKGEVKSCILDSEAVAWDVDNKRILPFQVLSTRKRKDAKEAEIKVQVCVFGFDLIYFNGEPLVKEILLKRREILKAHFQEIPGEFMFATSIDTSATEEIQEFLEESVKGNCEGLMVKMLEDRSSYELAKRSQKWLKLKKDYLESGGDSLDLVVIGGFLGKGKRTGTYGGFLLACYDPDEEVFQTICKIGTGFSDDDLQKHSTSLKDLVIPKPKSYYRYNSQLEPDHWFDAVQVWEVKCADLSLSPVHTAAEGKADSSRGISLRFPRFLRIRDDKNAEDATSADQVSQMYRNQEQVKNSSKDKNNDGDDDEFY